MSDLIQTILDELDNENIDYVHWKSNTNIEKALSGEDDLDILVDPHKKDEVYKLFKKYHIIRGYSEKDSWQNEIFHFFGLDIEKKELVHIHLHFLLEVGYDVDKSVNLPIVDKYIKDKERYKYIYIATVENEYVLLIIRLLLKNALIPYLLMLPTSQLRLYRNQKSNGIVTGSAYDEFIDLNNRVNREKLEKTLTDVFPFIKKEFFYECEKVIQDNNSLRDYFKYSKMLKKVLKPYIYHTELTSFFVSFYRINQGRISKLFRNKIKAKKIPENGGRIFAFVGGDGAGKTSNIEKLKKILKRHFYTTVIHVGRPNPQVLSTLFRVVGKLFKTIGFKDLWKAYGYLAIAYERKKAFIKALKIKNKGGIVLLDRVPLDGITAMDCPRVHTLGDKYLWLSKFEKAMYDQIDISQIDQLIALKLNPKIALTRRPEDDPDELLIRSGQIWEKDFTKMDNANAINTDNTFDYVEEEILKIVWNSINKKPLIFEIIGLAGSGKSTTIKILKSNDIEFKDSVEYPKINLSIANRLFNIIHIFSITKNMRHVKEYIAYRMLLKSLKDQKYPSEDVICFDQGPIFVLTKLILEIPTLEEYFLKELKEVLQYYGEVIYLEAPLEELSNRIKSRSQDHRIKDESIQEQYIFLNKYVVLYDTIIGLCMESGIRIVKIDTKKFNIEEVGELVFERIQNSK